MILPNEMKATNAFESVAIGTPRELFEKLGYQKSRNNYTTTEDEFNMPVNTADQASKVQAIDTGLKMEARRMATERQRQQAAIDAQKATKEANEQKADEQPDA